MVKVGYNVLDFPYSKNGVDASLTVAVWYPCHETPMVSGTETRCDVIPESGVPPRKGKSPLLIFSHGFAYSGSNFQYLARTLAASGFIVAAADHHDAYYVWRIREGKIKPPDDLAIQKITKRAAAASPADRAHYLYRADEVSTALNNMLDTSLFAPHIDRDKIALGGHSYGGFSAMALCGPLAEYHDARVKAAVLLSSSTACFLYDKRERAAINIPVIHFY